MISIHQFILRSALPWADECLQVWWKSAGYRQIFTHPFIKHRDDKSEEMLRPTGRHPESQLPFPLLYVLFWYPNQSNWTPRLVESPFVVMYSHCSTMSFNGVGFSPRRACKASVRTEQSTCCPRGHVGPCSPHFPLHSSNLPPFPWAFGTSHVRRQMIYFTVS